MPQDYGGLVKKFGGVTVPHESADAAIPLPEVRLKDAIGVQVVPGSRRSAGSDAIASVGVHEPHKVEINDPKRFAQGPQQVMGHEIVHLWMNQLPGPLQKAVPPDDPNHPYDISKVDELRKQGKRLWQLPQEQAAMVVQQWIGNPADRKRLQPWIDDMKTVPLSVEQPTAPDAKTLNMTPRAPLPPMESYQQMANVRREAIVRSPSRVLVSAPDGTVHAFPNEAAAAKFRVAAGVK